MSDIFSNLWVITIGVGIIVGLVLYYLFGIGKEKENKYKKSPHIIAGGNISAGRDIVVGSKIIKQKQGKNKPSPEIKIDFQEQKISWANYAVGRWVWSSFRMVLQINNFHNNSPEYIKPYLVAKSNDGEWKATNFVFQNPKNENDSHPNQDYRVEAKYKETISLFISDYDIGHSEQRTMPDIDRDTLKLVIEMESGKKFTLTIRAGWITQG